jgi:4-oxalocrotonate tautomerase
MPLAQITMLEGRSKEAKAEMADEIAESIAKHSGAPKEVVVVIFQEVTGDDWATGGITFNAKKAAKS